MHQYLLLLSLLITSSCASQTPAPAGPASGKLGGPCEGCEAIYECPVPFEQLGNTAQLPQGPEPAQELILKGRVTDSKGRPVAGVVIYIYHTDTKGLYSPEAAAKGWGRRHGRLRGWVRTGSNGEYLFRTRMPGTYPDRKAPAHIHMTLKEPGLDAYWVDEIEFDDDPLLTERERKSRQNRCGTGIVKLDRSQQVWIAVRNIELGRNIPGHPAY